MGGDESGKGKDSTAGEMGVRGRYYLDARVGGFDGAVTHAGNAVGFLVVEHHIGDGAHFSTFVPDVFFDLKYRGWVFLLIIF